MATEQQTGHFIWHDLMTTDQTRARAFYTALFGWSVESMPMGGETYDILANGGDRFGGIAQLDEGLDIPTHWIGYIATPDVDATTADAQAAGGSVRVPPTDIPNVGRFAVVADPGGAVFSPMTDRRAEASAQVGSPTFVPPMGGVTWNELWAADADSATAFYTRLFGYGTRMMPGAGPEPHDYTLLTLPGQSGPEPVAGLMPKPSDAPAPCWVVFFRVPALEAARQRVADLGGRNLEPVIEVPQQGRIACALDPTGGLFAIHETTS